MWTPAQGTADLETHFGRNEALALLTRLLADEVPAEALVIPPYADVLRHIGNTDATSFFHEDALSTHAYWARAWAARALAHLGDEDAAPWLLDALDDLHWRVRMNALQALGTLKVEGYDEILSDRLRDEHARVRAAAALALGRMGHEFALAPLREALEDEHEAVRKRADRALAAIEARLEEPVQGR